MKQIWVLDPYDLDVPEEVRQEIFDEIQAGKMSNGSYTTFWPEQWEELPETARYASNFFPVYTKFTVLIHW